MAKIIEAPKVPFIVEENKDGTWAIVENPESETYGTAGWAGEKVVRSPFASKDEAIERELSIAEYWGFQAILQN